MLDPGEVDCRDVKWNEWVQSVVQWFTLGVVMCIWGP